jgi:glycosyltransferase involved in cell wall biosynthesis
MPVYNGENFVREAIESILGQTFGDFELVLSDNASTDSTEEICREYAHLDARVTYHRNAENIGASGNYTRAFELTRGEYFKWAAHDDVCLPGFLASCVHVLDADPSVVLCCARTRTIDAHGCPGKRWPSRPAAAADDPATRFQEVLARNDTFPIWGVMRREVLERTPLLGSYPEHDRPLLAELSLYGRFHEIDEFLFLEREHVGRSVRAYDARRPHEAVVWYDPRQAGKLIFPAWRLLREYLAAVRRAPLSAGERARCHLLIGRWAMRSRRELLRDLQLAAARGRGVGPLLAGHYERRKRRQWSRRAGRVARDLEALVPRHHPLILVDEARFDPEIFRRWRTIPFLERGGAYAGPPTDERTAIRELERLRRAGAGFVAFAWPAFWWLDHYAEFHGYLQGRFRCLLRNKRVVLFDLRDAPESADAGI